MTRALALVAALLAAPGVVDAQGLLDKVDRPLQQALQRRDRSEQKQRVIIRAATREARRAIRDVLALHGHKVHSESSRIGALVADVHLDDLARVQGLMESASIDADVAAHAAKNNGSTTTTEVSFIKQVLGLGSIVAGGSVTVAVIDSGLQPNEDFSGRIVGQYDFVDGRGGVAVAPYDNHGHGTHVAGLIGSSGALSLGKYAGIAGSVKLLPLKVLDDKGRGRTSDVIAALEFAVRMKDVHGIRVINLSLGHPIYEPASRDPLVAAVENAVRAGIVVVVSAGNFGTDKDGVTGYAGITSPGNSPSALTVGASNPNGTEALSDDTVTRFSSRGPTWYDGMAKPDVVAPGVGLVSDATTAGTLTTTYSELVVTDSTKKFLKLTGTSMATGVVSGLAALMIDVNRIGAEQRAKDLYGAKWMNRYWVPPPDLSPNAVKALIQYSAIRLDDPASAGPYERLVQGTGAVNGLGALWLSYVTDTAVAPGAPWQTSPVPASTTIAGETHTWSQEITWGTTVMSGSGLVDIRQAAWSESTVWGQTDDNSVWGQLLDDNIVWGYSIFYGENIVWSANIAWGANIVWGDNIVWADNIVWGYGLLGTYDGTNVTWGYLLDDNIVWGYLLDDNIVWSLSDRIIQGLSLPGGGL